MDVEFRGILMLFTVGRGVQARFLTNIKWYKEASKRGKVEVVILLPERKYSMDIGYQR